MSFVCDQIHLSIRYCLLQRSAFSKSGRLFEFGDTADDSKLGVFIAQGKKSTKADEASFGTDGFTNKDATMTGSNAGDDFLPSEAWVHLIATVKAGGDREPNGAIPKATMTFYHKTAMMVNGSFFTGEAGVTTKTYQGGEHPQLATRAAHVFGKAVKKNARGQEEGFWDGTIAFARFWDNYALTKIEVIQVRPLLSITSSLTNRLLSTQLSHRFVLHDVIR